MFSLRLEDSSSTLKPYWDKRDEQPRSHRRSTPYPRDVVESHWEMAMVKPSMTPRKELSLF